ncbi:MAG: hypothetical protein K1X57_11745 [Gemmataceae bacterium]|nr:hypothetical protein [Gemmataceae bacterium]
MSRNLLLWKWSPEFNSAAKRKKVGLKFGDITAQFMASGDHPAIGDADITGFRAALEAVFGADELARPFVLKLHPKCAVVNYSEAVRFELVPKVADIGRRFGLNASEF